MIDTLSALDSIQVPGTIRTLDYRWAETDDWKDGVMRPDGSGSHNDSRTDRDDRPQYQLEADRLAVIREDDCPGCFYPESR